MNRRFLTYAAAAGIAASFIVYGLRKVYNNRKVYTAGEREPARLDALGHHELAEAEAYRRTEHEYGPLGI